MCSINVSSNGNDREESKLRQVWKIQLSCTSRCLMFFSHQFQVQCLLSLNPCTGLPGMVFGISLLRMKNSSLVYRWVCMIGCWFFPRVTRQHDPHSGMNLKVSGKEKNLPCGQNFWQCVWFFWSERWPEVWIYWLLIHDQLLMVWPYGQGLGRNRNGRLE